MTTSKQQGLVSIGDACGVEMGSGAHCWQPKGHDGPHGSVSPAQPVEQGEQERLYCSKCGEARGDEVYTCRKGGESVAAQHDEQERGEQGWTIWVCDGRGAYGGADALDMWGQCLIRHGEAAHACSRPARQVEVIPASSLTTANQQIEELTRKMGLWRRGHGEQLKGRHAAEAKIEELTRERDEAKRLAEFYMDGSKWRRDYEEFLARAEIAEAQRDTLREERQRPHIWIQRESFEGAEPQLVIGDEGGEFARADTFGMLAPYLNDLLYGDGTMREGPLPVLTTPPAKPSE